MCPKIWEVAPSQAGLNSVANVGNQTMKLANFSCLLLLALAVSTGLTGCKHRPYNPTPIPGKGPAVKGDQNPSDLANSGPIVPPPSEPKVNPLATNPDGTTELGARLPWDKYIQDR